MSTAEAHDRLIEQLGLSETVDAVTVQAGWGDDLAGADASNPNFRASLYDNYSQQTRRNLAYLNEVQIDYELLEELVLSLAESPEHGAILVFLPGKAPER